MTDQKWVRIETFRISDMQDEYYLQVSSENDLVELRDNDDDLLAIFNRPQFFDMLLAARDLWAARVAD